MPVLFHNHRDDCRVPYNRRIYNNGQNVRSPITLGVGIHITCRNHQSNTRDETMETQELIIAVVTILGSGAAFKFYEYTIKNKRESARELRQERREENPETMFREDLLKRVEEMSIALETAQGKILGLTQKVAELETENRYLQREIDILKRK